MNRFHGPIVLGFAALCVLLLGGWVQSVHPQGAAAAGKPDRRLAGAWRFRLSEAARQAWIT